jgi:hypothetical protein
MHGPSGWCGGPVAWTETEGNVYTVREAVWFERSAIVDSYGGVGVKSFEIPTKENSWMLILWIPLIAGGVLLPNHKLPLGVSIAISVIEVAIAVWALLRMRMKSSVQLSAQTIAVQRKDKVVKEIPVANIERVVISGSTFSVYGHGKTLPILIRAIQFREKPEKEVYLRTIADWCRRENVKVQV